ncbi:MAG: hypothetical protein E4H20_00415 [Spirochaetales bacterium]|nr:MAG: hypothetical protein E4H20_00415 [Spirochaetales bacterium]
MLVTFGCAPPVPMMNTQEESAVSVEDLLANLDSLGANQTNSMFPAVAITKPDGLPFCTEELTAYLDGIKVDFAGYITSSTTDKPYLVMPVRLRTGGESGLRWVPSTVPRNLIVPGLAADLVGMGPVWNRLRENTVFLAGWIPNMIVPMIHCPIDDIVPAANAVAVKAAYAMLPNVLPRFGCRRSHCLLP